MKKVVLVLMMCLMATSALAQGQAAEPAEDLNVPRPIPALDTVRIPEMTWMEIRDAIRAGKTTVIVGAGGLEQRGAYVNISNHNTSIRVESEIIARRLGNALVGPSIDIGPGDPEKTGNPGTFALRPEVFRMVITDICTNLKQAGFRDIILIGDNGSNQTPMKEVAAALNAAWGGAPTRVHFVPEYYGTHRIIDQKFLPAAGINQVHVPHTSFRVEALNMLHSPDSVRLSQRLPLGQMQVGGVSLLPVARTLDLARKMLEMKIGPTVEAIQKAVAGGRGSQ